MDLSKLNADDWLVGGGAIVFLISHVPAVVRRSTTFGVAFNDSRLRVLPHGLAPAGSC